MAYQTEEQSPSTTNTKVSGLTETLSYFPNRRILVELQNNFDKYFTNCRDAILFQENKEYKNNYIAMNQTISVVNHLESRYNMGGINTKKMRIEMKFLQEKRDIWNKMLED